MKKWLCTIFGLAAVFVVTLGYADSVPTVVGVSSLDGTSVTLYMVPSNSFPCSTDKLQFFQQPIAMDISYLVATTAIPADACVGQATINFTGLAPGTMYQAAIIYTSMPIPTTMSVNFSTAYNISAPAGVNIDSDSIKHQSAMVSWNAVAVGVNSSQPVQYQVTANGVTYPLTGSTSQLLSGLQGNTSYSATVQAIYPLAINSPTTTTSPSFTTKAYTMTAPSNVNVPASTVTATTASVSWTPAEWTGAENPNNDITYTVAVLNAAGDSVTGVAVANVTNSGANIGNLTPNTQYSVTVTATDASAGTSNSPKTSLPSASFTTTKYMMTPPSNIAASSITPTSATVTWSPIRWVNNVDNPNPSITYAASITPGTGVTVTPSSTSGNIAAISGLTPGTPYSVKVTATDASANTGNSPQTSGLPVTSFVTQYTMTAPSNVTVPPSSIKKTKATVTWDSAGWTGGINTNAKITYTVAVSPSNSNIIVTNSASGNNASIAGLTAGTLYSVTVTATDTSNTGTGNSPQTSSPAIPFTTASTTTITAPTNVTVIPASVTSNSAQISWVSSNTVKTTYSIVVSPAISQNLTGLTGTWVTLTGLTPGTNYSVTVSAVKKTQTAAAAPVPLTTNLVAPTAVNAPSGTITSNSATLYWASSNGSNTTYDIVLSPSTLQALTGLPFVATPLTGLTPGTVYSATVSAVNANASNSPIASLSPASFTTALVTPANVAVTNVTQTSATVSWDANSNPNTTTYTINVVYSASNKTAFSVTQASTPQQLTLKPNKNYYVTVQAINGNVQSAVVQSAPFSTTGYTLTAPTITGVSPQQTTATVSWSAATSTNPGSVIQYTVTANGVTYPVTTNTSQLLSNLQPNTSYSAKVSTAATGVSNTPLVVTSPSFTTTQYIMTPPTITNVNNKKSTTAVVSWIPAGWVNNVDNPNASITYTVSVSPSTGVTVTNVTSSGADIAGLTADTLYKVTVSALDANPNTGNPNPVTASQSFTTADADPIKPPTVNPATAVTSTSATITWTPGDTTKEAVYNVAVSPAIPPQNLTGLTGTSVVLQDLTPGTNYSVTVSASKGAGKKSKAAEPISFTTNAAAALSCTYTPSGFRAGWGTVTWLNYAGPALQCPAGSSITVSHVSGAQGYSACNITSSSTGSVYIKSNPNTTSHGSPAKSLTLHLNGTKAICTGYP